MEEMLAEMAQAVVPAGKEGLPVVNKQAMRSQLLEEKAKSPPNENAVSHTPLRDMINQSESLSKTWERCWVVDQATSGRAR